MYTNKRLQVILNHLQNPMIKNTSNTTYQYTTNNNLLSTEQRQFYEENGFLVIRNLIDHDLLDRCSDRFIDLANGKIKKGNMTLLRDKSLRKTDAKGVYLYSRVQDIIWDDVFVKYITNRVLLDYIECFVGPNIHAVHSMFLNKPPDSGALTSQHPIHQDLHFFAFRPANKIVACWTAIEKVTFENGCLFVVPGTHKSVLQPHEYPEDDVNVAFHALKGFDKIKKVNLPMEKGDTVFFHPLLFHGSWPNITKGFRKSISAHYASSDCYFIEDVTGTTQEHVAKEVGELAKMKFGIEVKFADIWRAKKMLVRGEEGNFV